MHAYLTPSKPSWLNYDEDKFDRVFYAALASQRGTALHEFASQAIKLGQKLPDVPKTVNMYVNDAIGFRLKPEQMLVYSENCYGTADAIDFRNNVLRVADLKTGAIEASFKQLEIYTALFCHEYKKNPLFIEIELRIYQNDMVKIYVPDADDIVHAMEKIKFFDKRIKALKEEAFS